MVRYIVECKVNYYLHNVQKNRNTRSIYLMSLASQGATVQDLYTDQTVIIYFIVFFFCHLADDTRGGAGELLATMGARILVVDVV